MKALFELRITRVAAAAAALAGGALTGAGVAAAAERPAVADERSSDAASVADDYRPLGESDGRKVG